LLVDSKFKYNGFLPYQSNLSAYGSFLIGKRSLLPEIIITRIAIYCQQFFVYMKIAEPLSSVSVKKLEPVTNFPPKSRRRKLSIVRNLDVKADIFRTWSMPKEPTGYMPVKKKDLF
jgi:hypothetical protein